MWFDFECCLNRLDEHKTDSAGQMEKFRRCWKAQGNDQRTDTKDSDGRP